ncbi:biotin-dependent carboxyltransferase family protein [Streptomyces sp. HM190]|uniref:5-oxoprolinase subunit C family protein n=1 Tax=Streptomyces sp. HM190 TaxID=2695266 RepID=UPI001356A3B1|nr:biotin-dependent carboxyltransferase family protein [Streptomyces sp. HM190]
MALEILRPGLMTTVQDEGRTQGYALGMPPSGAMDRFSYHVANALVGNPSGAAVLECTYLGPEIGFSQATTFAVTGADLPVHLNGKEIQPWASHRAEAGDVLGFGFLRSGARAYIAVAGGIDVEPVMGSRSTYTLCGMGGFQGRALRAGDLLPVGADATGTPGRSLPAALVPDFAGPAELRVVVGLASYRVTPDSLAAFFETEWQVTPDANRVGYRYRGGLVEWVPRTQPRGAGSDPANVVDIGYPIGSIQIPGGTEPIALLNDAVTGGGYATIGTIISSDIQVAGQTKTGDVTRFCPVSIDAALGARQEARARLAKAREAIEARS